MQGGGCHSGHADLVQMATAEATGKGGKRASEAPVPGAKQRMQKLFATAAMKPRHVVKPAATDETSDALLGDILGSIGAGDAARLANVA